MLNNYNYQRQSRTETRNLSNYRKKLSKSNKLTLIKYFFLSFLISSLSFGVITFTYLQLFKPTGFVLTLQETLVGSAMETMSHKWIANLVASPKRIDEIVKNQEVDDSTYKTEIFKLETQDISQTPEIENKPNIETTGNNIPVLIQDTYTQEGYEKLEDGIYFKQINEYNWQGYILLVKDPSKVSLAQTRQQLVRGDLIKTLVPHNNAKYGINAGGFVDGVNYDSNGGKPAGVVITNGEVTNGTHNVKYSAIGFNKDNQLVLGKYKLAELMEMEMRDCVEFAPFLIVNGECIIKDANTGGIAPRTAIGQRKTGEVLFLCVDGRQLHSAGSSLKPIQEVLYEEDCYNASMLDGGSSTVMYSLERGYLNKPSLGHERYINNCWIVK